MSSDLRATVAPTAGEARGRERERQRGARGKERQAEGQGETGKGKGRRERQRGSVREAKKVRDMRHRPNGYRPERDGVGGRDKTTGRGAKQP